MGSNNVYILEGKTQYKIGYSANVEERCVCINDELGKLGIVEDFKEIYSRSFSSKKAALSSEKLSHTKFKEYSSPFKVKFGGYSECYTDQLPINEVVAFINKSEDYIVKEVEPYCENAEGYVTSYKDFMKIQSYQGKKLSLELKATYYTFKLLNCDSEKYIHVSVKEICKSLGIGSRTTVIKYIEKLRDMGILKVISSKGKPNGYKTLPLNYKFIT